jgi:hypothetical protein
MYFNFSIIIFWKKTGLLRTEISNHNILYSSQKPRKSSSLPLKSSSQLFSLDASLIDVRVFISLGINTYPRRIKCSSNLGHIFREKKLSYRAGNTVYFRSSSALAINSRTVQPVRPCLNLQVFSSINYWINSALHQSQVDKFTWNVILYIMNLQADFYQKGREKLFPQHDKHLVMQELCKLGHQ